MRSRLANITRLILIAAAAGGMFVSLGGCESSRASTDPYVSMINNYIAGLDEWDYKSGNRPAAPRQPAFLSCGEAFGFGGYRGRLDTDKRLGGIQEPRQESARREQVLSSVARCEEINRQRQAAYIEAMKKYESVIKRQVE